MHLARHAAGIRGFDARTILIVDEASTIGDRDLRRLLAAAIDAGTTVRLIGDTAQHGSVPAGGSYADLVARYPDRTPELTDVRRLTDVGERARADARAGA
jgi:ATP-dependent exoDNAse (exonuclease V) alpha subunit